MTSARTILVTGSSSGIGQAIAERLLAEGQTVLGLARNPGAARERYVPISLAVTTGKSLGRDLREALKSHPAVDALVSNAGGGAFGNLEELAEDRIRARLELNLTSHILVTRAVLPLLKRHSRSDLILMGSEAALRGGRKGSIYCAAKFGLRGFGQSLRQECASSGLRVALINPGMVRTPFFDGLGFAPGEDPDNAIEPADVAAAVSMVLAARPGTVFDEINLSPLKKVVRSRSAEEDQARE